VLATPYGGWIFDLPVLLVPVLAVVARLVVTRRWWSFGAFLAGQVSVNLVSFATPGALHAYWWVTPTVLALCLLAVAPTPLHTLARHDQGRPAEGRTWRTGRRSTG
jgi:hypothetical protein